MVIRFAVCAAALFLVVRLYTRVIHVNPTTVALTFLVSVLIVSAVWGLRYALFTAFVAAAAFNYYFLPPTGTFTIADTQNWVALFAFLGTSIYAAHLAARIREESEEADTRRQESEMLEARERPCRGIDEHIYLMFDHKRPAHLRKSKIVTDA